MSPGAPVPDGVGLMRSAGLAARLDTDPEVRLTGHVYGQEYDDVPEGAWRAPGELTLLGGPKAALTVALPWGAIVVAASHRGRSELYSLNHHDRRVAQAPDDLPPWARPCQRALDAAPTDAGLRMVVNRVLPHPMALLSGAETFNAVSLALRDLYGLDLPVDAYAPAQAVLACAGAEPEPVPFDLRAAGLRLVLIEVGSATGAPGPAAVTSPHEVVAAAQDLLALGPALTRAHRWGTEPLDAALDAAVAAGALGGRAIGCCVVALAPMSRMRDIREAVTARLVGVARRPPRFLTAVPADGAHRVA
ncbi:hypothetical protein [Thermomonospora umbrina]|uniref:Galactokinase n=1 Tax=Thermomonospora umbrina TaxID=111806 RepID=A0A3D9SI48_9ACTN|nr:hypothetical protein [Thermomonospora umbrina]REE95367.1 hypothetical protein DFJ69_0754 [Thermomonospora umbrina]